MVDPERVRDCAKDEKRRNRVAKRNSKGRPEQAGDLGEMVSSSSHRKSSAGHKPRPSSSQKRSIERGLQKAKEWVRVVKKVPITGGNSKLLKEMLHKSGVREYQEGRAFVFLWSQFAKRSETQGGPADGKKRVLVGCWVAGPHQKADRSALGRPE